MVFTFDIDGTSAKYPEIFMALGHALKSAGHEVHLLTGIDMGTFNTKRKEKYPHFRDTTWYDRVITTAQYNNDERRLVPLVMDGRLDNHILVGIFKRRVCKELSVTLHFDDDVMNVRKDGAVPVFGVA